MTIKIGRKRYRCNTAMITLLNYRAEFGESFLKAFFDGRNYELSLVRLVWSSIEGRKPDFSRFLTAASKCKNFGAAALSIQAGVMISERTNTPQTIQPTESDIDEFDVLALMAAAGISMDLVRILPAFLIVNVVSKKIGISHDSKPSTGQVKFRKMSDSEIREAYRR